MNSIKRLLTLLVVIAMLIGTLASCELLGSSSTPDNGVEEPGDNSGNNPGEENPGEENPGEENPGEENPGEEIPEPEFIDYASTVKFNPNSGRAHVEVKVKSYIDGDTTHFETLDGTQIAGLEYIKARYLSINTPESTGVIEPWGKKASNYTKSQLMKATSIIVESDTDGWNLDSTGGRLLLWVWYKTAEDTEYRNLNLEILQQGLAYGSNVSSNVYGEIALKILNQAKEFKLHVFDKATKDPDYYYGGAIELSLKELKANCEKYEGMLVKFEAVVAKQVDATIYVEEYDAENDMYFGMQIFAGYSFPRMEIFTIGNRLSIVGTLQYYENGGTYQISNLKYKTIDPDWNGGCRVIGEGFEPSFKEISVKDLMTGKITLQGYEQILDDSGEVIDEVLVNKEFKYGDIAHYSTVSVLNLTVTKVYTTTSDTDSNGALTITCRAADGTTIDIRTASQLTKIVDGQKVAVTAADFPAGTVISVKGVIDSFNGKYQIKVFEIEDVTFA